MSNSNLFIIISSADPYVIKDVALMYGPNAPKYGWMDEVVLIFWGSTQKSILENKDLGDYVKELVGREHLKIMACKACSDGYGVSEKLEELGITVKYVGENVSNMLKQGWHSLTF